MSTTQPLYQEVRCLLYKNVKLKLRKNLLIFHFHHNTRQYGWI